MEEHTEGWLRRGRKKLREYEEAKDKHFKKAVIVTISKCCQAIN